VDPKGVVAISRGVAVVLLICYGAYLIFQLVTHKYLYTLEASKQNAQGAYETAGEGVVGPEKGQAVFRVPSVFRKSSETDRNESTSQDPKTHSEETATEAATAPKGVTDKKKDDPEAVKEASEAEDDDEEEPQLKVWIAAALLVVVTVFTGVTAEFLVSSIDGMTTKSHVNKEFVALILLPLVVSEVITLDAQSLISCSG
jgi:Ca2+:H+ antiporter